MTLVFLKNFVKRLSIQHSWGCSSKTRLFFCIAKVDKVRKNAKIRNRYNQAPHPTQDTTWERVKNVLKKRVPEAWSNRLEKTKFAQEITKDT